MQAFLEELVFGGEEIRAPLKTPAWEAILWQTFTHEIPPFVSRLSGVPPYKPWEYPPPHYPGT